MHFHDDERESASIASAMDAREARAKRERDADGMQESYQSNVHIRKRDVCSREALFPLRPFFVCEREKDRERENSATTARVPLLLE